MQKQIQKSFDECFPKNKKISNNQPECPSPSCKSPKTPSFADAIETENGAVPLSGTDQSLFQNLRSFYRSQCEEEMAKIGRNASLQFESPLLSETPPLSPRALTMKKASSTAEEIAANDFAADDDDSVAILTYSRSPYEDFRRSMQEMVEARLEREGEVDHKFMEELLFRYLNLNSENCHSCIMRAFLDLIVVSREDSERFLARRQPSWSGRRARRRLKLEIKRMRKILS